MIGAVVDAAGDDRPIGIAAEEAHDDLHPDTRNEQGPVARASPALLHADPTARVGGAMSMLPIPVELHSHPRVLIGLDVLSARAHHRRGLRSRDERPPRATRRT